MITPLGQVEGACRRAGQLAHTKCGQQTARELAAGSEGRQRELLRGWGNAPGLLWPVAWGAAAAGDETIRRAAVGLGFG